MLSNSWNMLMNTKLLNCDVIYIRVVSIGIKYIALGDLEA